MQPNHDSRPLIPTDAYLFFPTEKETRNCAGARLMFDGNLKLDANEIKMMEQFKAHAQKNNYTLKSLWTDSMIVRFLQANGFKMDKTLTAVKEHTIWRETRLPARLSDPVKKFLEKGYLYIHGRDHKFRPIVVFSAYLIEVKNFDVDLMIEALTYFFSYMIDNLLLPGQVENWIFITDLKGMGLASIPLNPIRKLLGYLQHNYRGRLSVMYIVNAPASVYIPWQMVKGFLEESTVKKIQFLKKQVPEPLFEHANKEQVEEKYGGTAANLTRFWPPIVPSSNYFLRKEESRCLVSKEDYKIMYEKGLLEKHTLNMQLIQDDVQAESHSHNTVSTEVKFLAEHAKSSISQEETNSESNSPNVIQASPELKIGSVHKELMYSVSDTFQVKAEKAERAPISKYKTCLNPQFDDGDYMDGMEENHDIVIKSPYVRDFEAYFMGKSELRKMSKKM